MHNFIKDKLRASDAVLVIYVASVVRQFFWGIEGQRTAWLLTTLVSVFIVITHANLREPAEDDLGSSSLPRWYWAFVTTAPLALIYVLRFSIPDKNFDVLNYHLEYMERGLRGFPFIAGDFFPTGIQFSPTADMATGIVKYAFGYRLGTILNLGSMAWTASLVLRAIRNGFSRPVLRYIAVIYVISTELILYLLSTYLVDLLALPLLLEATLIAINYEKLQRKTYALIHVGLFLGISLSFKLTCLAYIIPIGTVLLYQAFRGGERIATLKGLSLSVLALIVSAAPFLLYMWVQTENPIFPYYNNVFHSPLWNNLNIEDPNHGPKSLVELLLWPFWVYIFPERGSEFVGGDSVYTGRIALGFIFGTVALVARGFQPEVRKLGFIAVVSTLLWSASTGNLRYGLFLEILGGVVTLSVLTATLKNWTNHNSSKGRLRCAALISSFVMFFCMQLATSYRQAATLDQRTFGDKVQFTVFQSPRLSLAQLPYLFRDRDVLSFLPDWQEAEVKSAGVWINSYQTTASLMSSLNPEIPMISVAPFLEGADIYDALKTEAARERCAAALAIARGKRLYSIVPKERLGKALFNLRRGGLRATEVIDFPMPFYSPDLPLKLTLIKLEAEEDAKVQYLK